MQSAVLELLAALSAVLDRRGRWYVFGAQAVVAYGVPRFSADVDVTLNSPWQKSALHSTGVASRLTSSFVGCICPICALLTPCQAGPPPVSVRRGTFTTGC